MQTFIALYRGDTISTARLVAVSSDPELVAAVAEALLTITPLPTDPVLGAIERGRRGALRVLRNRVPEE